MYIRRLIYTPAGNIMISILLGLGLATLFRKSCKNRNCLVFQAPPIDKIKKIYYLCALINNRGREPH